MPQHEVKVIGHGPIDSKETLLDVVRSCKKEGYIKHFSCDPVTHYWQIAFPVIFMENMPDMSGNALILYTGSQASFDYWMQDVMRKLERASQIRSKVPFVPGMPGMLQ